MPLVPVQPNDYINTHTLALSTLLNQHSFRVPDYQRSYSWDASDQDGPVHQLWEDILEAYSRNFPRTDHTAPYSTHFLGTVVLLSEHDDPAAFPEIIDGQQRTVTLSLLLSRARAITDNQDTRQNLQQLLVAPGVIGGPPSPRIHLNELSHFFGAYVASAITQLEQKQALEQLHTNDIDHPVVRRIVACSKFFDEKLAEFVEQHPTEEDIHNLLYTITELMLLIRLELRKPEMAYRVFETLNARGLDLTQADLIKNLILQRTDEQFGPAELDQAKGNWSAMRSSFDSIEDTLAAPDAIQLSFQSRYGSVQSTKLFERIKEKLNEGVTPIEYSMNLMEDAKGLDRLIDGSDTMSQSAATALSDLKSPLNISRAYSVLLAAWRRYGNDPDRLSQTILLTRNFCFRFFTIGSGSLDLLTKHLLEGARLVRDSEDPIESLVEYYRQESPDGIFREEFAKFSPGTHKLAFHILWHIEMYLGAGEGIAVLTQSPTQHLEHIFPQTPGNEWALETGDTEDLRPLYTKRLGNLLVLERGINSYVKNRGFAFKISNEEQRDYIHSRLILPEGVEAFALDGEWGIESIENRQTFMAENFACQIWPLGITN